MPTKPVFYAQAAVCENTVDTERFRMVMLDFRDELTHTTAVQNTHHTSQAAVCYG